MDKIKQYIYYILIGVISVLCLGFLPFLGTEVGLIWNIPNTPAGWIVWAITKAIIALVNVLIFHCFVQQGKVNVLNDQRYIDAIERLNKTKIKEERPRSPARWRGRTYGGKGVSIFFISALSTVALSQAIFTYDWISLISYIFTIFFGVIFGILQMKSSESYWTEEFPRYVSMKIEEEKNDVDEPEDVGEPGDVDEPEDVDEKEEIK